MGRIIFDEMFWEEAATQLNNIRNELEILDDQMKSVKAELSCFSKQFQFGKEMSGIESLYQKTGEEISDLYSMMGKIKNCYLETERKNCELVEGLSGYSGRTVGRAKMQAGTYYQEVFGEIPEVRIRETVASANVIHEPWVIDILGEI